MQQKHILASLFFWFILCVCVCVCSFVFLLSNHKHLCLTVVEISQYYFGMEGNSVKSGNMHAIFHSQTPGWNKKCISNAVSTARYKWEVYRMIGTKNIRSARIWMHTQVIKSTQTIARLWILHTSMCCNLWASGPCTEYSG